MAFLTAAVLALVLAPPAQLEAETPRLDRVEPAVVAPYQPVVLRLYGRGFLEGARVFIEAHQVGRFVVHLPSSVSEDVCELALPLGFGATPKTRRLYVANRGGDRSPFVELRIDASPPAIPEAPKKTEPETETDAKGPVIDALRPATVPPGRPFVLEILGSGFVEGAVVEITANLNAGTSRLPEYGPRHFATQWLDSGLLEVELDRGFFPIPGLRDVVVRNPDAAASAAMALRIQPMEVPQ